MDTIVLVGTPTLGSGGVNMIGELNVGWYN